MRLDYLLDDCEWRVQGAVCSLLGRRGSGRRVSLCSTLLELLLLLPEQLQTALCLFLSFAKLLVKLLSTCWVLLDGVGRLRGGLRWWRWFGGLGTGCLEVFSHDWLLAGSYLDALDGLGGDNGLCRLVGAGDAIVSTTYCRWGYRVCRQNIYQ